MIKTILKKYGKIAAAAVFLTAAGLYYGFAEGAVEMRTIGNDGQLITAETKADSWFQSLGILDSDDEDETDSTSEVQEELAALTETEDVPGIFVHICGEVMEPGVYELPEDSRIFEVVEAAGGFTEFAAEASLNQAQKITDGMQIVILSVEEAEEQARLERERASGIVNLNTATKEQLMTLTGIGESRAEDIIRYREEAGGFQTIEDIMKVPGIKESAYLKIKDSISV